MVRMPMFLLLGAVVVLAACTPSGQSPTSEKIEQLSTVDIDERTIVWLTPQERMHVLEEMNQFLLSTQEIVEGIALGDDALIQSAVSDGLGRGRGQGQTKGALPGEFRQMGSAMKLELKKMIHCQKAERMTPLY